MQTPAKSTAKHSGKTVIRPTADRAREAIFNIIGSEIEKATVLDLFAGTGALGLEALSRSARLAVLVDSSPEAERIVNKNVAICGFSDRAVVFNRDLSKGLYFLPRQLPGESFSIVFIDPPYRKGLTEKLLQEIVKLNIFSTDALIIVEDDACTELVSDVAGLNLVDQRRYGDSGFWFYRKINT